MKLYNIQMAKYVVKTSYKVYQEFEDSYFETEPEIVELKKNL